MDNPVRQLKLSDKLTPEAAEMEYQMYGRRVVTLGDLLQHREPEWYKRHIKACNDLNAKKVVKAFADNGASDGYVTADETNISQNGSIDTPLEPIPGESEYRGISIPEQDTEADKSKEEKKNEPEVKETVPEEKAEHAKLIETLKKHLGMEGIDKELKKQGEEILANLEEAVKVEENAYAFLEKLKPLDKVPVEGEVPTPKAEPTKV